MLPRRGRDGGDRGRTPGRVRTKAKRAKKKPHAEDASAQKNAPRGARLTTEATTAHRLKIELVDVKPRVWRRIEIASGAKLPFVSHVLLAAMGWTDSHLHAFEARGVRYGTRDPDFPDNTRSERSVRLADIAPNVKDRFLFDYDFGDGWKHRVTVEAVGETTDADVPRCIAGARACPPEDCGGPGGYVELLEILADPEREEHQRMRSWVGPDFDPREFDLVGTNETLRRLARRRRAPRRLD